MKVYVVVSVARQELGEYIFVTTEKAFSDRPKAEEYLRSRATQWKESIQGVTCTCERGIHEIEVE